MALQMEWYDFFCVAVIVGSVICSVVIIYRSEGFGRRQFNKHKYESLLLSGLTVDEAELGATSMLGYVSSEQLWMTSWKGLHPGWLLATRLVSVVVLAGILIWDFWTYGAQELYYYTEWTSLLAFIYFVIATLVSAKGCSCYSKQNSTWFSTAYTMEDSLLPTRRDATLADTATSRIHGRRKAVEKKAGFLGYTMQIIYQISAGAVTITDIVYWAVIAPFLSQGQYSLNGLSGCKHSLNLVFLILDSILNNMPFRWFRVAYFLLWTYAYVVFQWLVHAFGLVSWWPYPFIVLSSPWAPLWYFCLAFVHIPSYSFYCLIVKAKASLCSKLFPDAYAENY